MHLMILAILLVLAWTVLEEKQNSHSDPEDFMDVAGTVSRPAQPDNENQNK
jgi:hypothetical protein